MKKLALTLLVLTVVLFQTCCAEMLIDVQEDCMFINEIFKTLAYLPDSVTRSFDDESYINNPATIFLISDYRQLDVYGGRYAGVYDGRIPALYVTTSIYPECNEIISRERVIGCLLHEMGHRFDHIKHFLSYSEEFQDIYSSEKELFKNTTIFVLKGGTLCF